jgi:tRNA 2-thiouridine synthesizing protein A
LALETLDTRGLLCPLPVIRTQDRIRNLEPGSLLEVTASDAGTLHDIPAWCRIHGHELLTTEQIEEEIARGKIYRFTIRVAAAQ